MNFNWICCLGVTVVFTVYVFVSSWLFSSCYLFPLWSCCDLYSTMSRKYFCWYNRKYAEIKLKPNTKSALGTKIYRKKRKTEYIAAPKLWLLHKPQLELVKPQRAIDISGWMICCVGDCSVYYRMFSNIPGPILLHASSTSPLPYMTTSLLTAWAYGPEKVSQLWHKEISGKPTGIYELRGWSWDSRQTKTFRVCRVEQLRIKTCAQSRKDMEIWDSIKSASSID